MKYRIQQEYDGTYTIQRYSSRSWTTTSHIFKEGDLDLAKVMCDMLVARSDFTPKVVYEAGEDG